MQAAARLRCRVRCRQQRRLGARVGNRAGDQAGSAAQDELDPVDIPHATGAVPQRIGDQLRHHDGGVLSQHDQTPAAQDVPGELACLRCRHARVQPRPARGWRQPARQQELRQAGQ
jgi:hypothetical protein